jgi:hypothetical protein
VFCIVDFSQVAWPHWLAWPPPSLHLATAQLQSSPLPLPPCPSTWPPGDVQVRHDRDRGHGRRRGERRQRQDGNRVRGGGVRRGLRLGCNSRGQRPWPAARGWWRRCAWARLPSGVKRLFPHKALMCHSRVAVLGPSLACLKASCMCLFLHLPWITSLPCPGSTYIPGRDALCIGALGSKHAFWDGFVWCTTVGARDRH